MNKVIAENFSVAKPPEGIVFVAEKLSAPMEPPMWQTIIAGLLASTLGFPSSPKASENPHAALKDLT